MSCPAKGTKAFNGPGIVDRGGMRRLAQLHAAGSVCLIPADADEALLDAAAVGGGRDLSRVVEAIKDAVKGAKGKPKKKAAGDSKGITQARRAYTNSRKGKLAALRALKAKRIKEFAAKTKKLPKADRSKQRRAFKQKVEAQFKQMQAKFPTARGLQSVTAVRELIRQIEAVKIAS